MFFLLVNPGFEGSEAKVYNSFGFIFTKLNLADINTGWDKSRFIVDYMKHGVYSGIIIFHTNICKPTFAPP